MRDKGIWKRFIDRTARRPEGRWAVWSYNNPKAHYRSFRVIMDALNLKENDIYCEIGCGGGVLLNMSMAKAQRGAAIDHSRAMVDLSKRNNLEYIQKGRLEILQGSAERLPWDECSFTACASANMFFFVEDPHAMLSEVFRVLKPGGRFSMATGGKGLLVKLTFGWLYSLRTYSDAEMDAMFREAGFINIKIKSTMGLMQICYGERPV